MANCIEVCFGTFKLFSNRPNIFLFACLSFGLVGLIVNDFRTAPISHSSKQNRILGISVICDETVF